MPLPRPPGVYFQRADSPAWAVDEARSDVAGFVGIAERGPLHEPVCVQSGTQFFTRFGRSRRDYAHLPDAVHGFFANGGRTAWVVRVGRPVDPFEHASLFLVDDHNRPMFRVWAKDPGLGGGTISVRVLPAVGSRFHLAVDVSSDSGKRETLEIWRDLERHRYLPNRAPNDRKPNDRKPNDRYIARVVNGWSGVKPPAGRKPEATVESGSVLIVIEDLGVEAEKGGEETETGVKRAEKIAGVKVLKSAAESARLTGSVAFTSEGLLGWNDDFVSATRRSVLHGLTSDHFLGDENQEWGLAALERVDDVSIVAIPDLMWRSAPARPHVIPPCPCDPNPAPVVPEDPVEIRVEFPPDVRKSAQLEVLAHCVRMRNRFAILDAPDDSDPVRVQQWADGLHSAAGQFGALYFPWIGVSTASPGVHWMPPSGHLAGLYARVDLSSGVQKSPANEVLSEVQGVMFEVSDETHGQLNVEGVNVLKATGARGVRVMGARTLVDPLAGELDQWRFVSVRRLLLMLEKSLERSAFWLVQTDNRPERWRDVERVIRNFLRREWQLGRLGGTTAEEAFSVECNESTNPWEDVERGRMTCVIGVQPPLPAEFVFVRLGDRGGSAGTWSFGESRHGTT